MSKEAREHTYTHQQEPEYQTNKHKLVTHNLGDISKVRVHA